MKKIFISAILLIITGFASCSKQTEEYQVEKVIEKEVVKNVEVEVIEEVEVPVYPTPKEEKNVSFFLEEADPIIIANRSNSDTYLSLKAYQNDIYMSVETTNGASKSYSVQKLDLATSTLSPVLTNLPSLKDFCVTDRHILVCTDSKIDGYAKTSKEIDVRITPASDTPASVLMVDNHLIFRTNKRLRFYDYSSIIKENQGRFRPFVVGAEYSRDNMLSLAVIGNQLFHSDVNIYGKGLIVVYHLQEDKTITNNQQFNRGLAENQNNRYYGITPYKNVLYAGMGDKGFAKISTEINGNIKQMYSTYKGNPINVTSVLSLGEKLYAINNNNNQILVYDTKNIVIKKY